MKIYNQCVENISRVMREVWPQASLHPKGITAAVMAPKKEICNHLYAVHCDDLEGVKQFEELAIKQGFHLEFGTDNRGLPAVICTDCVSGVKSCITYGPEAEKKCKGTSDILRDAYSSTQSARDVLFVLLALLQQNRILDDGGLNQKLFSGEALAVMLLSVVNSYENNLLPDSGRILLDFFLTFGFVAYFNPVASSVTIKTMQPPRPRHMTSQLSVLDPADETINLTPSLDRVSNVQTVFSYCYSALNQYTQVSSGQRRAQSVLSTIIGGEPYWIRVFRLYEQGVDPYYTFIAEHKAALYQSQHGS
ncbi:hypothetical protein AGDE_00743 [Angomonas deanei]|nr:hypothetical protein AGDE_00743 [Angomonas deanei]|eukprot:EPY43179.1 hypothetical protein AGDE_00743 [Angomonas deanei]